MQRIFGFADVVEQKAAAFFEGIDELIRGFEVVVILDFRRDFDALGAGGDGFENPGRFPLNLGRTFGIGLGALHLLRHHRKDSAFYLGDVDGADGDRPGFLAGPEDPLGGVKTGDLVEEKISGPCEVIRKQGAIGGSEAGHDDILVPFLRVTLNVS